MNGGSGKVTREQAVGYLIGERIVADKAGKGCVGTTAAGVEGEGAVVGSCKYRRNQRRRSNTIIDVIVEHAVGWDVMVAKGPPQHAAGITVALDKIGGETSDLLPVGVD